MLRAGNSDYPYQLYQRAGVDMATPAPYRALVARMNRIMDEIEACSRRRPGTSAASAVAATTVRQHQVRGVIAQLAWPRAAIEIGCSMRVVWLAAIFALTCWTMTEW